MRIIILLCLFKVFICNTVCAQYVYGTTGLLHIPTAEMNRDKTFMVGGSFLQKEAIPASFNYNTYNYYINMTFFPWLEVGYTCTLKYAEYGSTYFPEKVWGKYSNQDRAFHLKVRLFKEGQYFEYMPNVVIGINDVLTNDKGGDKNDYGIAIVGKNSNGSWNRYYIALSKHFQIKHKGELGIHLAYVYNKRVDYHLKGPAIGTNFRFKLSDTSFINKAMNGLNLMAEYDSRTINCGFEYSFWKDHINAIVEFNQCKYFSGGLVFKVHLK